MLLPGDETSILMLVALQNFPLKAMLNGELALVTLMHVPM